MSCPALCPALLGRLGTRVLGETLMLLSRSLLECCDTERRWDSDTAVAATAELSYAL